MPYAEVAVLRPLLGQQEQGTDAEEHRIRSGEHPHDVRSHPDPHVWHNPQNGIKIVAVIQDNLALLVPAQVSLHTQRAKQLTAELKQIDA